jgi:nucleotide-binding universal stress UspA family protein
VETTQTMSPADLHGSVKLQSVFHPSDFSEASEVAFAHALKVALVASTKLTLLHVQEGPGTEWEHFPGVRSSDGDLFRRAARGAQ